MTFKSNRYQRSNFHKDKFFNVVDFNKNYTRRFKCFLKDIDATDGDTYWQFEFTVFIEAKWKEFEQLTGRKEFRYAKTMEVQDQFDDFLETGQIPLF